MASRDEYLKKLREANATAGLLKGVNAAGQIAGGATTGAQQFSNKVPNQIAEGATTGAQQFSNKVPNQIANGMLAGLQNTINYSQNNNGIPDFNSIISQYKWNTGANLLEPDSPLIQSVNYNNEFSPENTSAMANNIYNEYYAPLVQQQQKLNTQAYRDAAATATAQAGAAGMATGSRGSIQAMNQANREAQDANLVYQMQQQVQAFQDTLNARNLELQNKIQDYANAWEEVSQYGYVVTEKTGQLLGIQPGQQLTTTEYKNIMSTIAARTAEAEAQKVTLAQNQQQLEISAQYQKEQVTNTLYNRLIDMLSRYETVTPEMVELGKQVGMSMQVGDYTTNYMSEAEIQANTQNQTSATDNRVISQLSTNLLPYIQQITGVTNAATFAEYISNQIAAGSTAFQLQQAIKDMSDEELVKIGLSASKESKNSAISMLSKTIGGEGAIFQTQLSDSQKATAINQLQGNGLLTGSYLTAITNYVSSPVLNGYSGGYKTIRVTSNTGNVKDFNLPPTLTAFDSIANKLNLWNTGVGGIGDRFVANQYIRENFYDANGNLLSAIQL